MLVGLVSCLRGRMTKEPSINDPEHWAAAAWLQVIAVVLLVVILHVPLGNYMARVYADSEHWRVERVIYRLIGAQPDDRQRWQRYGVRWPTRCCDVRAP